MKRLTMKRVWKEAKSEQNDLRASQLFCEFAGELIDSIIIQNK